MDLFEQVLRYRNIENAARFLVDAISEGFEESIVYAHHDLKAALDEGSG